MRAQVERKETMTSQPETLKFYTATGCEPCIEIKEALEEGNYDILGIEGEPEVEAIDLATEENYGLIEDQAIEVIPAAYYGTRQCKIFVDDATKKVTFDCRQDDEAKPEHEQKANS